jgi:hypothetical protein
MSSRPVHPRKRSRLDREQSPRSRSSSFREVSRIVLAIILGVAVAHALLHVTGLVLAPTS